MKIDFIGSGSWKDISSFGNNIIKRGFRASVDEASEKAIKDQKSESWYLFRIAQSHSRDFQQIHKHYDIRFHLTSEHKPEYISPLFPCIPFQFHRRFHQTMWLFIYQIICIIMEPKSVHDNIEWRFARRRAEEWNDDDASNNIFWFLFLSLFCSTTAPRCQRGKGNHCKALKLYTSKASFASVLLNAFSLQLRLFLLLLPLLFLVTFLIYSFLHADDVLTYIYFW